MILERFTPSTEDAHDSNKHHLIQLVDAVRVVMTKLLTQARRDDWSSTYTLDMFRYRICTFLITSNTRQVPYS